MESQNSHWSKIELEIYILLLCANTDAVETEEELNAIKEKFDQSTFDNVYREFKNDSEEEGLKKIESNIGFHEYSFKELCEIRSDMKKVFYSDKKYNLAEQNMERILNRILY